jgi:hypothetical protein
MTEKTQPDLEHKTFWSRMEQNTRCVEQMPAWVKGSPVNERAVAAGAGSGASSSVSSSEALSNASEMPKPTADQ